jgi:hypothetical protein
MVWVERRGRMSEVEQARWHEKKKSWKNREKMRAFVCGGRGLLLVPELVEQQIHQKLLPHDGYMEEPLCSNMESALYKVGALHQFMETDTGKPHT